MWSLPIRSSRHRRAGPRRRLLRDLLLLLAVTSGSLLAAVFYAGETLRDDLAKSQLQELASVTGRDFVGFFRPAEKALRMAKGWGEAGDLDMQNPAALTGRFIPVLETLSKTSALVIADADGNSFYLARQGDGWQSRSVDAGGDAVWRQWEGPGVQTDERRGRLDFDVDARPWYQGALQSGDSEVVFWTRPYLFFTLRTPGVTGALAFQHQGRKYVVGLDLPLKGILQALTELKVGDRGEAFLAESGGEVLLPHAAESRDGHAIPVSLSPQRFHAGPVFEAVEAWTDAERPEREPVSFDDGDWWTWMQPIGRADGLWLGVAVPEVDFLGAVQTGWHLVLLVGVLVLAAGLVLTLALTRRYSRQFVTLPAFTGDSAEFEQKIRTVIRAGESPTVEFKSTMRANLKTGKAGKEIELAWLKGVVGFLNTDGGVLLIGVNDDGDLLGLEADAFENEDKCLLHFKNLINQHIGAEYSKYIQAELCVLDGKQLLAVSCEKAVEPVFLMIGKNEEFHIRSGPSSMKLTPRQMVQYLS